MIDYNIYIIHWLINPILIFVLSRIIMGTLRVLSFPMVFLISYFILIYIQALNIYINEERNFEYLISVWLIPYIFLIVIYFTKDIMFKHNITKMKKALNNYSYSIVDEFILKLTPFISSIFILVTIIYVADIGFSNLSIIFLIFNPGDSVEAMNLRIGGLTSNIHPLLTSVYSYSRSLLYPIYASVLMIFFLNKKIRKSHFFLLISTGCFFSIATSSKAPIAIFLIAILLTYFFAKDNKLKRLIISASVIITIPAFIYPLMYGVSGIESLIVTIENLWRRVTWVPSHTASVYFDIFPEFFPHLGTSSNRWIALITNADYQGAAGLVYNEYYNTSIEGGLVNSSYFASFYADWGIYGVLFGTILVGVLLSLLQIFYDSFTGSKVNIAFRAMTTLAVPQLMLTNFYSVALGRGLISTTIILIFIILLINVVKTKKNNRYAGIEKIH